MGLPTREIEVEVGRERGKGEEGMEKDRGREEMKGVKDGRMNGGWYHICYFQFVRFLYLLSSIIFVIYCLVTVRLSEYVFGLVSGTNGSSSLNSESQPKCCVYAWV